MWNNTYPNFDTMPYSQEVSAATTASLPNLVPVECMSDGYDSDDEACMDSVIAEIVIKMSPNDTVADQRIAAMTNIEDAHQIVHYYEAKRVQRRRALPSFSLLYEACLKIIDFGSEWHSIQLGPSLFASETFFVYIVGRSDEQDLVSNLIYNKYKDVIVPPTQRVTFYPIMHIDMIRYTVADR